MTPTSPPTSGPTKGPWTYEDGGVWAKSVGGRPIIIADSVSEENGRLIASAPDLKAEVERLRMDLSNCEKVLGFVRADLKQAEERIWEARRALAGSEGRG